MMEGGGMLVPAAMMFSEVAAIAIVVALAWLLHRAVLDYLSDDHRRPR